MGVKITALPKITLPYRGSEEFPLVQNFETKAATVSSLSNYLSGDFASLNKQNRFTTHQSIVGNLSVTGAISASVFNAVSANFTFIDIKQYELSGFNISGNLSASGSAIFNGSLSSNNIIYDSRGNSNNWNSVYSSVNTTSANWNSVYTMVCANSANWNNTYTAVSPNSANWNSVYTTVCANSATTWNYQGTDLKNLSSGWVGGNIAYTNLIANSGAYLSSTDLSFLSVSGNWNSVYTMVCANSANWNNTYTAVSPNSANWNSVYTMVCALSTSWEETADILPTVTNYLSTNNVLLSSATISNNLTVSDNVVFHKNLSAVGIAYTRELDFGSSERPSLTGIKQALNSFLYVAPALSYVRINNNSSPPILEVGQALITPAITWTSNKVEAAAVSNYLLTLPTGITSTGSNTFTFSGFNDNNTYNITTLPGTDFQATSSWFVRVTDWANAQSTSSVTATWRYRVYYGTTSQATPTDAQVRAGAEADTLATSRTGLGSRTVTPNNEYMYVAYPSRFGATSQFRVNGLPNTAFTLVTINPFTNAYGGTAQYFVYRSDNLLTGTYTIEII